jgi:hypothetical protein
MTNTTSTPKFTKKMDFTAIIEILNADKSCEVIDSETADRLIARMEREIELLDKKNSADRKPTKNQQANEVLADLILDTMELNRLYTISELIKLLPNQENGEPYTQSKISAVVRSMVTVTAKGVVNPDGVIERTEEKGKAYFRKLDLE